MPWRVSIIALSLLLTTYSHSQDIKRTYNWYFGHYAGLNFATGNPVVLDDGNLYDGTHRGCVTMSDTNGNLLFYTNGERIWNKNHTSMYANIGSYLSMQVVSFPKPGSDHEYYLFSVSYGGYFLSFYTIIDMSMNGGLGGITGPVVLDAAWDAVYKLCATYHKNQEDIWVITRKFTESKYASFLVTANGVNTTPLLSPAPPAPSGERQGVMKISYDKKYLITCFKGGIPENSDAIEVCRFNDADGTVEYLYTFQVRDDNYPGDNLETSGAEFSPDSKFLYLTANWWSVWGDTGLIYQYEMQYIEDSASFVASAVNVGPGYKKSDLQLGPDGRIYVTGQNSPPPYPEYLGVINEPWKKGTLCDYEEPGIYLTPGSASWRVPTILPDFLYRFVYHGICEDEPFHFTQYFNPEPEEILWNFGDPGSGWANNTSNELDPDHLFSDGGTYTVWVRATYPDGRIEETSREVEVAFVPEPDLGPDTAICPDGSLTLNAYCGPYFYQWNTGAFNSQITVSDTGLYWVEATSPEACIARDSIHVGYFPPSMIDNSNTVISPTTCGGETGAITGAQVQGNGPFSYTWLNEAGDSVGNSLDLYHLGVGNYRLVITDNFGCETVSSPYVIYDAGDILINNVSYQPEHCGHLDGSIYIEAVAGLSNMLFYSIDNGQTYYTNQGIFDGIGAGPYVVRVKDSTDCQCVYVDNPVVIEPLGSPQIIDIQVDPATYGNYDGGIVLQASGNSNSIFYSIDAGSTFQVNDGNFPNLSAGNYLCVVSDEYGCDTSFVVTVPYEYSTNLQAIAGDDDQCPGNSAFVPLVANNFNDVAGFSATIFYNPDFLNCIGFTDADPLLMDSLNVILFPAEGRIELTWNAQVTSLPDSSVLLRLVFTALNTGFSNITWDGTPGVSKFLDPLGNEIPVEFYTGSVKVYNELKIDIDTEESLCQGEDIVLSAMIITSNGDVTFTWTDPDGIGYSGYSFLLHNAQPSHSGNYYLSLVDTVGCSCETIISVNVFPLPLAAFSGVDTIHGQGAVILDAGAGFMEYLWNTGENTQTTTVSDSGWYEVSLTSYEGCASSDSIFVMLQESPDEEAGMYLPNAFTPNGDGLNDDFKPIVNAELLDHYRMSIYSRWGEKVFESDDPGRGWLGFNKDEPCMSDVYVYVIEYSYSFAPQDEIKFIQGTFTLIR